MMSLGPNQNSAIITEVYNLKPEINLKFGTITDH